MLGIFEPPMPRSLQIAAILALAGGAVAVWSAAVALAQVGADPAYQDRIAFGWAALVLGILTTAGVFLVARPPLAATTLLIGSLAGGVAINLFYINTFYVLALPLWWAAALLVAVGRPRRRLS